MNKVFLSGYLIRDPEIRYTPTGKAVAKMAISVKRRTKNAETGYYDSDVFNLTAWEKTAEFCGRYFTKGSRVLLEGRLQTNISEKDGTKRYFTDITIDNIEFADSGRSGDNSGGRSNYQNNSRNNDPGGFDGDFPGEPVSDDDVPF